jgi:4-hydroxy-tetrahydrodipicolinate synthase
VIRQVVETAAGRVPVVAGTGSNSTREAIELTQAAMEAGADACLLVTPYYVKPTQILYNVPGRTAVDMQNVTVERLSHISNIVGIKDATGNLDRGRELIAMCSQRIDIYSGDDATAMELILMGAKGDISVTANVAPRAMHDMCAAARAGDRAAASAINDKLMGLHKNLFVEANPIPVKWAVQQLGLIPGGIRLPLTPLSAAHHETVRQAMRQAGVL